MFLHLGSEIAVSIKDIIGIFDLQSTAKSKNNQKLLNDYLEAGCVCRTIEGEPRSFVITESRNKHGNANPTVHIYYSPISALTLQKRAGFIDEVEKF